jgi:hypothetical protein
MSSLFQPGFYRNAEKVLDFSEKTFYLLLHVFSLPSFPGREHPTGPNSGYRHQEITCRQQSCRCNGAFFQSDIVWTETAELSQYF